MTKRAFILGLAFVIIQSAITPYNNFYIQGTKIAGNHFPLGSVLVLLMLTLGLNTILRRVRPESELSAGELIVVWMMLVISSGIPGMGLMQFLFPVLVVPVYFAKPENEWVEVLHPHLPKWLVVWDKMAVMNFYEGDEVVPWLVWLKPLCAWFAFALVLYFVTICLCVILRKQWVERERYTFPLVQVPLDVVERPNPPALLNSFFRSKLVLIGILLPFVVHLINGLHRYFPAVPELPLRVDLYKPFTEKPWYVMRWWPPLRLFLYFSVIGVTYLLTLEVSFSCWFFFLLYKVQYIIIAAFSLPVNPWVSASRQVMGGYLVLLGGMLWVSRAHLLSVFKKAFAFNDPVDDSEEPLSYRWAVFGLIFGFVALLVMCSIAGMSLWVAFGVIVAVFIISTVLTWMVINGGLLLVQAPLFPSEYLEIPLGTRILGPTNVTLFAYQRIHLRDWGEFFMPSVMHGFKVTDAVELNRRRLLGAMGVAVIVAMGVACYVSLSLIYSKGALNMQHWTYINAPRGYFQHISSLLQYPRTTQWNDVYSMLIGGGVMFLLLFLRRTFIWWPLHPIGYAVGAVYSSYYLWSSIFIGWLIKYIILKFGGIRLYRNLRPLFVAMIVGEYIIVSIWMIIGIFTGIGYFALPG